MRLPWCFLQDCRAGQPDVATEEETQNNQLYNSLCMFSLAIRNQIVATHTPRIASLIGRVSKVPQGPRRSLQALQPLQGRC